MVCGRADVLLARSLRTSTSISRVPEALIQLFLQKRILDHYAVLLGGLEPALRYREAAHSIIDVLISMFTSINISLYLYTVISILSSYIYTYILIYIYSKYPST